MKLEWSVVVVERGCGGIVVVAPVRRWMWELERVEQQEGQRRGSERERRGVSALLYSLCCFLS